MAKEHSLGLMGKSMKGNGKMGKPWNLISYYKDGNIEVKIVNGKQIKQLTLLKNKPHHLL